MPYLTPPQKTHALNTGEPFGKAGAYGIQGLAGSFVRRIDGCFYNVVGFPVNEFSRQLLRLIDEGHLPLDEAPGEAAWVGGAHRTGDWAGK